ncbi:type VI secretion system lipoprotein TssJ [Pseudomonas tolaasii]|uniref:Type VI secretion system lipoprotein TssJ n=2 Tax=Pseudomonas tolaasii TaxID=29442 RepID=A0A7Y8AMP2_PSETO|nr:type VI secretion system lipoprotein TssJ [Pseudomonas tolaasii]ARB29272.1 type VI secretion lipoprotein [Pseudomonas tolaasii]KAB0471006.1 type VI secretion system lipoprotein TssJ [Pseudomonas tolaasii]MBY8939328.1 type VI secretion system lipoprotein TssJ [Pseudomonas tolaasii]NWC18986.1 type VI secretion system lipoprotein TssJ [Pseudomonas tolaasii]NWC42184.1 type VI secretion system lipoprotein TssJ [Pseudomonas tolaasii]
MYRANLVLTLFLVGLLTGCSAISPFSTLTKLDVKLTAHERVNPDLHGRPSPVVVRLFELRHAAAFENADFFSLYTHAEQVLPKDWINSEEIELRPGEQQVLKLRLEPDTRFVGVLAAYRNLPNVQWRRVISVNSQQLNRADWVLDEAGIRCALPASLTEAE